MSFKGNRTVTKNMRIWKGPEMEGPHKGTMTLFIKGEEIDGRVVVKYLQRNPDCNRLYLGAGREDMYFVHAKTNLVAYCSLNKITVVLETSFMGLSVAQKHLYQFAISEIDNSLIVRFDDSRFDDVDFVKFDNHLDVRVADLKKDVYFTPLTDLNLSLNKDTFGGDIVLKEIGVDFDE